MRWMLCALLGWFSPEALADNELDLYEEDQQIAQKFFIGGASAPILLVAGAMAGEERPVLAGSLGGAGVVMSAVTLPLLGRKAMLAGDHLGLTAGKGAICLFFGIGTTLSGAYYVLVDQSTVGGLAYLGFTAASLTLGGLQLRENRFVASMRTDPHARSLYLTPTSQGLMLSGTF